MKRIKLKKNYRIRNVYIFIFVLIFIITSVLLSYIGSRATENMLFISRNIINTISTNTVNNNIKLDLLKKYNMNNLITINYQDKQVVSVNYDLDKAYEILIYIKKSIIDNIANNTNDIYNYKYKIDKNKVIIQMPFYNYTNNILIANLGPKIMIELSMVQLIDGSVNTKIKTYGINSLLVELYINFSITSTIVVPYEREKNTTNSYNVLVSSKVIQGEIPKFYNGMLEQTSGIITT